MTAIVGLWLSTGPCLTVIFLAFSMLAQWGWGTLICVDLMYYVNLHWLWFMFSCLHVCLWR